MKNEVEKPYRVKLTKGAQDYYGKGDHSKFGEWIAGQIPVGSTGTVRLVKDCYPEYGGTDSGPYCIIWDHNPTPKSGYYWGFTPGYNYDGLESPQTA